MKSVQELLDLADRFERKVFAQQPIVSQSGTMELFFGDENKQRAFNGAIQSGAISKYLTDVATKTQKTAGFDLKMQANPKQGAAWMLTTTPPNLKGNVSKLLDAEFRKIVGKGMADAQKAADTAAKAGGGSGALDVGSFSADMD